MLSKDVSSKDVLYAQTHVVTMEEEEEEEEGSTKALFVEPKAVPVVAPGGSPVMTCGLIG